jgi:hypothetical protein
LTGTADSAVAVQIQNGLQICISDSMDSLSALWHMNAADPHLKTMHPDAEQPQTGDMQASN